MKYFIDTHDKAKGSFPPGELSEEEFFAQFDALEAVAPQFQAFAHAAHVNLKDGKAFCFMCGPDKESIRRAHEAVPFNEQRRELAEREDDSLGTLYMGPRPRFLSH